MPEEIPPMIATGTTNNGDYTYQVTSSTGQLPTVVSLEWATLQALEQRVAALEAQMARVFKEAHGLK